MAGGYGAGSFGAGFADAFSKVLLQNRQQKQAEKEREFTTLLPHILQLDAEAGDYSRSEKFISDFDPDLAAALKKNSPFNDLHKFIGPQLKMSAAQPQAAQPATGAFGLPLPAAEPAPPGMNVVGQAQQTPLPSSTIATEPVPGTTAPPAGSTFFGTPVLTPTQRAQQHAQEVVAENKLLIDARRQIARQIWPNQPDKVNDYALYGNRPPNQSATTFQAIPVEVPDGKGGWTQMEARFNRATGTFEDPDTGEVLKDARRVTMTGTQTVGVDREAIAHAKYGKPFLQLSQEQQQDVLNQETARAAEKTTATTTARVGVEAKAGLNTKQRFDALMSLQDDWRKAEAPQREMERQYQLMQTGLKRFKEGDKIGGSQAVLVTFQKILDPSSVVRESEYARSPAGLALADRLQGFVERLSQGGAGVPEAELAQMAETARQFLVGMQDWNALEKERIGSTATEYGLNPERVFGVAAAGAAGASGGGGSKMPAPTSPTTPTSTTKAYQDANGNWIIP